MYTLSSLYTAQKISNEKPLNSSNLVLLSCSSPVQAWDPLQESFLSSSCQAFLYALGIPLPH